jgi:hypothetical protein
MSLRALFIILIFLPSGCVGNQKQEVELISFDDEPLTLKIRGSFRIDNRMYEIKSTKPHSQYVDFENQKKIFKAIENSNRTNKIYDIFGEVYNYSDYLNGIINENPYNTTFGVTCNWDYIFVVRDVKEVE